MPVVRTRRRTPDAKGRSEEDHPKVELVERGNELRVEYTHAPKLTHDGMARRFNELERQGRKPRLGKGGRNLERISYEALFAHRNPQQAVEDRLLVIERMAARGRPVRFRNFGPAEDGWYEITELTIADELRQHGTNLRTRGTVNMTLTEASDVDKNVGPTSGGHKAKGSDKDEKGGGLLIIKGGRDKDDERAGWPKTYRVKAGDTLSALAIRFYDDASKWRRIADANDVRDPRRLRVGQRLTIPKP